MSTDGARTVVVGAGLSGLALAHALVRAGETPLVLEATDRVGGNIRSRCEQGFLTEDGPNGYLDREPSMTELVESLGLLPRLREASSLAKRRFIIREGALCEVPSAPPAFLRSPVLPWTAKLRLLGELFTRRPRKVEDESLASFFRRHIGRTATRILVDAVQTGIFAGDSERLSARAAFPKLGQLEEVHRSLVLGLVRGRSASRKALPAGQPVATGALRTFDEGLEVLPRALHARLGGAVRLQAPVSALARSTSGWTLTLGGGSASVEAERVVLATPSDVSARLLAPISPALSAELAGIEHAPVAVVHLGYLAPGMESPPGFGFLAGHAEALDLLGAIYVSTAFPFRASPGSVLLSCMMGGARRPELLDLSDGELVARAEATVKRILGLASEASYRRVVRWPRAIPQYNVGHLARLARIQAGLHGLPGLHLTGNSYDGVGLNDCVRAATMLAKRLSAERARGEPPPTHG